MEQQMGVRVSRRGFLKGVAVAGIMGSVAAGVLAARARADEGEAEEPAAAGTVTLHRGYRAAHGDSCFTQVVVAVGADGTILAASVDEYQFGDASAEGIVPVPSSDGGFAEGIVEGKVLFSKSESDEYYSGRLAEAAGATQGWRESMAAIEAFAVGKTPEELEDVDAVSGATLNDTPSYCAAIADVALDDTLTCVGEGDLSSVAFGRALGAPHGDKAFGSAVTLVGGDGAIIATSIDEFQFMSVDVEGLEPVPNSDAEASFGSNYAEGVALASKSVNNESYSASLAEKAGATTEWLVSIEAIEDALVGVEANGEVDVDAISGATLADTANYAALALDAAGAVAE